MIVYTGGSFDVPHVGHASFLWRCSQFGEVIVSLNTDDFIEQYKGRPPLFSYREREQLLLKLPFVSDVIQNIGGADSTVAIDGVEPDMIIIGSDWATRDYHKQMGFTQEWLDERGIILTYIPYTEGISTTEIKKRMLQ